MDTAEFNVRLPDGQNVQVGLVPNDRTMQYVYKQLETKYHLKKNFYLLTTSSIEVDLNEEVSNFMFISLHEAAAACPDSGAAELEDKLCRFLCRIQAESEDQPYLNGAWLRGFDWELWDYYGSAADSGWGAWSVESGWSCSWISATLALRSLKKSLWDCYPDGWLNPHLEEILRELNINCL